MREEPHPYKVTSHTRSFIGVARLKMAARSGDRSLVSAFNLVPLVDQVLQDKQIECVCYWDKVLYIGTVDGMILCYNITSIKSPYGKIIYQPKIKSRRQLDSDKKKHLQQLTIIPNMNRLIALLDGSLYLLDMHKLEVIDTRDRITKVICYCIDEARTSSFYNQCEVVVAQLKKKSISIYTLANDKFQLSRDIAVSDQPVTMSRDGDNLCVALSTNFFDAGRYTLINLQTNEIVPLPSYEMGVTPFIKRTTKDEFLINNGELGLIVTSDGTSNRPPVEWKSISPTAACYHFPYIIVWSEKTRKIHVFSLIDQMLKQEISFTDSAPRYMGQFHSKLYVAFNSGVYLIVPVPLKDQVTDLLENGKVEEAILLAETIAAVDEVKNPDMAIEYISDIKKRAAFICFSQGQYSKSETLLVEGNVDPREIISKFDNLLIKSSTYVPAVHIPTAEELAEDGKIKLTEARKFLIRYLKDVRTSSLSLGRKEEIDTALVKLLAQETTPSLTNYMQNYDMFLNFEEAKDSFEKNQRYFALGLLCFYNGSPDDALDIWTRIYDKKLADDHFPGFDYITDFITKYVNNDLLLKYSTWILNHDQRKGAAVFIHQPESIGKIRPALPHNVVLEKLSLYVEASMMYLEHLIHDLNSKEENFHTRLGMLYLERVLKLKDENELELLAEARTKLKAFLEESTLYRASVLLNRVQDTDLYHECAILYGRMDDHEKALDLLAHKVQDYDEAERYCHMNSKGCSRQERQKIYQTLLNTYLRPTDSSKPPLIKQVLKLLNTHGEEFDAAKVLEVLPSQWEINTVDQFLVRSIRSTTNAMRSSKIERNLAKGENLQVKCDLMKIQEEPIKITEKRICPVCQGTFTDGTVFVRYPTGIITHLKCGRNKNICPITGAWFSE